MKFSVYFLHHDAHLLNIHLAALTSSPKIAAHPRTSILLSIEESGLHPTKARLLIFRLSSSDGLLADELLDHAVGVLRVFRL